VPQRIDLEATAIAAEQGHAYTVDLAPPSDLLRLWPSDQESRPSGSALRLLEHGREAGPAHAPHGDIRAKGFGRYSHWGAKLYLSATDNSDPRTNARRYVVVVPMGVSPGAAWVAGLLAGLMLLAAGSTIAPPVSAVAAAVASSVTRFRSSASALWSRIVTVVALTALRLARYRPSVSALVICAACGTAVAIGVQALWVPQRIDLASTAIVAEQGHAYTVDLAPPNDLLRLRPSDQESGAGGSALRLLEDGREIGPAHAPHDDIRVKGSGRYSHWGARLYLSATDSSNPRTNGRRYVVVAPVTLAPSAAWGAGLLVGLMLLAAWSTVARCVAAAATATASGLRRFRPGVPALVVSAACSLGLAVGLQVLASSQHIDVTPNAIAPEQGHAYTIDIGPPMSLLRLGPSDRESGAGGSAVRLLEDGREIGPAHAPHDDIRAKGSGRYSHWGAKLYLSAADSSDPRTNGRRYVVVVPVTLSPGAAWAAGLLIGAVLLAGWGFRRGRRPAAAGDSHS
jgi:hypothetical protein